MNFRLRRSWRRFFWQRLTNPRGQTRPAFIVGCGRSGTSMLLHRLGRSWAVDPFNEDNTAAFDQYRLRPLDAIEQLIDHSYARIALFKPVLTTPHSCAYLERFPDARLIFVYRHYYDVANSSIKRFGPDDRLAHVNDWVDGGHAGGFDFAEFAPISPPEASKDAVYALWRPDLDPHSAAALYWLFYNRLYFDLGLDREDRVRLIGYESLVVNAVPQIKEICAFLDLEYQPVMTAGIFSSSVGRDDPPVIAPHIESACETLWQQLQQGSDSGSELKSETYARS